MKKILSELERLKNSGVAKVVGSRIRGFEALGKKPSREIFKELCFCLLTANFSAERSIKIQNEIGNRFITLPEGELSKRLAQLGHRYPNARAKYILNARPYADSVKGVLSGFKTELEMREWLVQNVKGLGYKEASHFLRNIGAKDIAIIDFHIIDLLCRHGLCIRPKNKCLSKKAYLEIEETLRRLGNSAGLNLAELDLYLWYMETRKILK